MPRSRPPTVHASDRPDLLGGEDLPRPPQQERSLARRNRIEDAALALFGERGYGATSVEDIARAADIPVGGFYLHFRTKRQLLLSLMNDLLIALGRIGFDPPPGAQPRALIRRLLERGFDTEVRYVGAYRAWREAVLTDEQLAAKQREIHEWTTARVTAVFARLQKLPSARRGVDIATLARVMDSVFWDLLSRGSRRRDADFNRALDTTTDLVYHALFGDEADR